MKDALLIIGSVLSIFIVLLILIQGRGAGLGSAWGGGGELFQTRRGIEKWTLWLTVIFIVILFIVSVAKLLL
ncbi:MAG TPA: preprotein translocase subunit SecG [Patescibacteria group bacterium]|nr:preprotein translocase subunit SecG [Patescibacteria group bacterium]